MSNARRWVRWIQYGALAIVVGAIAADFLFQDRYPEAFAWVERGFMMLVAVPVGFMVLGLGWQALSDLTRSPTEGVTGPVEVSLHAPRVGQWVVVLILILGGAACVWFYLTWPERDPDFTPVAAWALHLQIMVGLFVLIWAVLLLGFLSMAIRKAPWFVLTPRGFLYAPGGVSPGFVRWEDVTGLRETEIVSGRGRQSPQLERVLAIGLRDPSKYSARYNPMLGLLVRLGGQLYAAQTEGPADILINPADFGARYDEIRARMEALHAEARR
ncbi:hypothetical protein [Lysobacter brunescens]|uniref:Bacterial Pleckstrin homology domain-containing protein n=1 Tax=Lysobacter brunescens TaxID=262323 RepID=A0ABW2Y6P5_9GAMM